MLVSELPRLQSLFNEMTLLISGNVQLRNWLSFCPPPEISAKSEPPGEQLAEYKPISLHPWPEKALVLLLGISYTGCLC